jgi:serine protease Do
VVRVEAQVGNGTGSAVNDLRELFGADPTEIVGQGSGVLLQADGIILTNYHVVRDAQQVSVFVHGVTPMPAHIVGVDALTDLALLRIDGRNLPTARWGDSDQLQPGEFVWAVGSPYGLPRSVSLGIVSALPGDADLGSPVSDFLKTDAPIHPGHSGGPLVNHRGEVVGITTSILGRTYQGVSFAIPSESARQVADQLLRHGRVPRGWLGVTLQPVSVERARQANLAKPAGAYVVSMETSPGGPSPAQQAGLMPGDLIVAWNDQPLESPMQLTRQVARAAVGSTAQLTVLRAGQRLLKTIELGERPGG